MPTRTSQPPLADEFADEAEPCQLCGPDHWVTVVNDDAGNYLGSDPNRPEYYRSVRRPYCVAARRAGKSPAEHLAECKCPTVQVCIVTIGTYPCPNCLPVMFIRWEAGCYRPGHRGCGKCQS